jgi:hypothetical protein
MVKFNKFLLCSFSIAIIVGGNRPLEQQHDYNQYAFIKPSDIYENSQYQLN